MTIFVELLSLKGVGDGIALHKKVVVIDNIPKKAEDLCSICGSYRNLRISLLVLITNKYKRVTNPMRNRVSDIIIWQPKNKELSKIAKYYGKYFFGTDNWMKLYKQCIVKKDDFCYMSFQQGLPTMSRNFDEVIAIGGERI